MQQHTRRLALVVASSLVAGVALLVACSDDSAVPIPGGSTSGTTGDSGHPTSSSSSGTSGNPGGGDDDDDGGIPDAAGVDCSTAAKLHSTASGFFCAFFKDGGADSGSTSNCANDETCCDNGKIGTNHATSYCAQTDNKGDNGQTDCTAGAAAYPGVTWIPEGASTWECGSSTNCGGKKCCAFSLAGTDGGIYIAKDTGTGAPPAACQPYYVSKIGGSKCADDCAPKGEFELCSTTDPCSDTSKKCQPASTTGFRDIGVCR